MTEVLSLQNWGGFYYRVKLGFADRVLTVRQAAGNDEGYAEGALRLCIVAIAVSKFPYKDPPKIPAMQQTFYVMIHEPRLLKAQDFVMTSKAFSCCGTIIAFTRQSCLHLQRAVTYLVA